MAFTRFQSIERKAFRTRSGVTVTRTTLRAPDFPETFPFLMPRPPHGYDPSHLSAHREDAGELHAFDQADGDVADFAVPLAQAGPLNGRRREDHRSDLKTDPVLSAG
jgi:hypothetical protein